MMINSKIKDKVYSNRNSTLEKIYTTIHGSRRNTDNYRFAIGIVYNATLGYTIPNCKFKATLNKILTRGFHNL